MELAPGGRLAEVVLEGAQRALAVTEAVASPLAQLPVSWVSLAAYCLPFTRCSVTNGGQSLFLSSSHSSRLSFTGLGGDTEYSVCWPRSAWGHAASIESTRQAPIQWAGTC